MLGSRAVTQRYKVCPGVTIPHGATIGSQEGGGSGREGLVQAGEAGLRQGRPV